jgi:cutinase
VAAVVAFGNPLGISGRTIATASPVYGPRSKDYCNTGDPVCGSGNNVVAHLQYGSNGMTAAGAKFAAGLVTQGASTSLPTTPSVTTPPPTATTPPPATTTPRPSTTTPPPATITPPPATTTPRPATTTPAPATTPAPCVTATAAQHIAAGRAARVLWLAVAKGSNTIIGSAHTTKTVSLSQGGASNWTLVARC